MKNHSFSFLIIVLLTSLFIFENLFAEEKEEKWPNGKTSKKYNVDSENKKSGSYNEFYEGGQPKIKASYKNDLLEGLYQEFLEDGKKSHEAQYNKGLKNGIVRYYEKGLIAKDEFWLQGVLAFPKTIAEITRTLATIPKLKTEFVGDWPKDFKMTRFSKAVEADNTTALTKLREFRYICDLPYEDLQINREYVAHNLDATILLIKINHLDHTPANPGLPEDVYKSGYRGTSTSNLSFGTGGMSGSKSVEGYMDDSDKSNIDRVGHRRWCLNPSMKMTGFGSEGSFSAMWSMDKGREKVPEFDFICFPARGYMPGAYFNSSYAWSVSLNPNLYSTPDKASVKVHLSLLKGQVKSELKISYFNVETSGFGINNCIIFKPDGVSESPKTRYHVLIEGIKDKSGKDSKIEYFVEFF